MNNRSTKRRRRRPPQQFHSATAAEEKFLQHAIQNSRIDKGRPADGKIDVPLGPVFYPTVEDFEGNPIAYVQKIRPIAERYGICKIVPPAGWNPAPVGLDFESNKKFQTKLQCLHRLQEGISFGDGVDYDFAEYQRVASERAKEWKATSYPNHDLLSRHYSTEASGEQNGETTNNDAEDKKYTPENLERDYWNIVETRSKEVAVEYGNDMDTAEYGSGFPLSERGRCLNGTKDREKADLPEPKFGTEEYYKETWWNLNNMPFAPTSVLRHVRAAINGINVPWLYCGSLFTTFCWHNEDNYLYSINYHHRGAPKLWYGVPGDKSAADGLEKVFKSYLSMKMRDVPDLLHHITTMFSPRLLQHADVPVYKLVQQEGEYVVTFPRAFHGGFSLGPNIGEAVNFASNDWISFGSDANERYRSFARPAVFSHDRLTFTMASHLREQLTYSNCKLLLDELERVVEEELTSRRSLRESGVRDVSNLISLPKNKLHHLDEESASYDDKRLCHCCKHVCFFSAVACECSQSRVSCLRHSHFMCSCPPQRRYFMVWSDEEELKNTLARVRFRCSSLKDQNGESNVGHGGAGDARNSDGHSPGTKSDVANRRAYDIPTEAVRAESFEKPLFNGRRTLLSDTSTERNGGLTRDKPPFLSAVVLEPSVCVDESSFSQEAEDVEIVRVVAPTL